AVTGQLQRTRFARELEMHHALWPGSECSVARHSGACYQGPGAEVIEVKAKLFLFVVRIQRRGNRARCHGQEEDGRLGAVREDERHAVRPFDASAPQLSGEAGYLAPQLAIAQHADFASSDSTNRKRLIRAHRKDICQCLHCHSSRTPKSAKSPLDAQPAARPQMPDSIRSAYRATTASSGD